MTVDLVFDPRSPAPKLPEVATEAEQVATEAPERPGDRPVTTYHQLTQEREQQLEADALATGHDALRLQAQRGALPTYPRQPSNVWTGVDRDRPPPLGYDPEAVADVTKLGGRRDQAPPTPDQAREYRSPLGGVAT
jgi:hypothetical protein